MGELLPKGPITIRSRYPVLLRRWAGRRNSGITGRNTNLRWPEVRRVLLCHEAPARLWSGAKNDECITRCHISQMERHSLFQHFCEYGIHVREAELQNHGEADWLPGNCIKQRPQLGHNGSRRRTGNRLMSKIVPSTQLNKSETKQFQNCFEIVLFSA